MKNKKPAKKGFLSATAMAYSILSEGGQRWLVHNSGVELDLVGGPYTDQRSFADALIDTLAAADVGEEDTFHILTFGNDGPEFSDFSVKFMDAARTIAAAAEHDDLTSECKIVYGK